MDQTFAADLVSRSLAPLWNVLHSLVPDRPKSVCTPALWPFADIRPLIMRAGALISAHEAERRVLILENPAFAGQGRVSSSLYAGVQLILPAESAPPHRHSQSALRFILEGEGGFTIVGDERIDMRFGDLILTPPGAWHAHGNDGNSPVIWLDGLDIPTVAFYEAGFAEQRLGASSQALLGNLDRFDSRRDAAHPNVYPFSAARKKLHKMSVSRTSDPCHGFRNFYGIDEIGEHVLPTISAALQYLPPSFDGTPFRTTDSLIFACAEGTGHTDIDGKTFSWGPRDIFVAPGWSEVAHRSTEGAILFSYSDRSAQEKLGLWHEWRADSGQPANSD